MPNMKIIGTDKPNSHWCRPSDSRGGRPPKCLTPKDLTVLIRFRRKNLTPCISAVSGRQTNILESDLGYAGAELLLVLKKKKEFSSSQRHYLPDTSNTTSYETQASAFSKIPDKSLAPELHQCPHTTDIIYILHHGSKTSKRWLAYSLSTIYITHYSFEELRRVFVLPWEIRCELNVKMKTWNTLILFYMQWNSLWGIKCSSTAFMCTTGSGFCLMLSTFHPAPSWGKFLTFVTLPWSTFTN